MCCCCSNLSARLTKTALPVDARSSRVAAGSVGVRDFFWNGVLIAVSRRSRLSVVSTRRFLTQFEAIDGVILT